jgi:hypothetical protein
VQQKRNEWDEVLELITWGNQNDHTERRPRQVLLELKILIRSKENFEPFGGGAAQQLAVT